MKNRLAAFVFAMGALTVAMTATADVIYDNGYDNSGGATASDFDFPFQVADDFQLQPGNVTITDIHWWGVYAFDNIASADDFTIRIFANNGDEPAGNPIHEFTNLAVTRVLSGALVSGFYTEYAYDVDIAPVVLSANTTYWLSIVNNTDDVADNWYWSHNVFGTAAARDSDTDVWQARAYEYSFYLTGPGAMVPEPASMTLLGLGLAGLVLRKCRRA